LGAGRVKHSSSRSEWCAEVGWGRGMFWRGVTAHWGPFNSTSSNKTKGKLAGVGQKWYKCSHRGGQCPSPVSLGPRVAGINFINFPLLLGPVIVDSWLKASQMQCLTVLCHQTEMKMSTGLCFFWRLVGWRSVFLLFSVLEAAFLPWLTALPVFQVHCVLFTPDKCTDCSPALFRWCWGFLWWHWTPWRSPSV
jgi:hypothetical protein